MRAQRQANLGPLGQKRPLDDVGLVQIGDEAVGNPSVDREERVVHRDVAREADRPITGKPLVLEDIGNSSSAPVAARYSRPISAWGRTRPPAIIVLRLKQLPQRGGERDQAEPEKRDQRERIGERDPDHPEHDEEYSDCEHCSAIKRCRCAGSSILCNRLSNVCAHPNCSLT